MRDCPVAEEPVALITLCMFPCPGDRDSSYWQYVNGDKDMRIMGIDYGTKRIGVAISDPSATMAHPLDTIPVREDGSHLDLLGKVVRDYEITKVVVGLPVNMDGSMGESARKVTEWAQALEHSLGLPVELWDERLTTSEAHELLIRLEVKGRKRRHIIDKIAASIILQDYLEAKCT